MSAEEKLLFADNVAQAAGAFSVRDAQKYSLASTNAAGSVSAPSASIVLVVPAAHKTLAVVPVSQPVVETDIDKPEVALVDTVT